MSAAFVLWLALAYRIRGHRPDSGFLRTVMHPVFTLRPLWAASVFGVVYMLTGDLWIAGAVAIGEWIGLHIRHAPGQDMGTWRGSIWGDVLYMVRVGAMRGAIVFAAVIAPLVVVTHFNGAGLTWLAVVYPFVWGIPVLYAITLPLSYFVGWRIPWRVPHILRGGIEWSEFLTGASRAVVFVLVFGA